MTLISCLYLLTASPAHSLIIDIIGADGAPGTDGQAAVAMAISSDASNVATAEGGRGGLGSVSVPPIGKGGDAVATANTSVAGNALARASAEGGRGGTAALAPDGPPFLPGGSGGSALASASAESSGSGDAIAEATVRGGEGGSNFGAEGGAPGGASLGTIWAHSASRDARATGELAGGDGGGSVGLAGGAGTDGDTAILVDAVDAEAPRSIELNQTAFGGSGGSSLYDLAGDGGDATSELSRSKSALLVELGVRAVGGAGGPNFRTAAGGNGGAASVSTAGENADGMSRVAAAARGGDGKQSGRGGDARGTAFGSTRGDGHTVVVGSGCLLCAPPPGCGSNCATARGGEGGILSMLPGVAGRGGDAESVSEGVALGDSEVTVEDGAVGGNGGFVRGPLGVPGSGGNASSTARASGAGDSHVRASATAAGGIGGSDDLGQPPLPVGEIGRGGDALARAHASGPGQVSSFASAVAGGAPRRNGMTGDALAQATATGASGEAHAQAETSGHQISRLRVSASANVHGDTSAEALVQSSMGVLPATPSADAYAAAKLFPGAAIIDAALAVSPGVTSAFSEAGLEVVLAAGRFDFDPTSRPGAPSTKTAALEILPNAFEVSVLQEVLVGFVDPAGTGSGSLRFRARMRDQTLVDMTFDELEEALGYFDERVLDLGNFGIIGNPPIALTTPLELILDWTGTEEASGFGLGFIVGLTPIPEPSTGVLLALGLAVLAARARRRRALI